MYAVRPSRVPVLVSLRANLANESEQLALSLDSREAGARNRFVEFHAAHPEVYSDLVRFAYEARRRGWQRIGIRLLWERVRWERGPHEIGSDGFALNDHLHALYARKIVAEHPDLDGLFEFRRLRSHA